MGDFPNWTGKDMIRAIAPCIRAGEPTVGLGSTEPPNVDQRIWADHAPWRPLATSIGAPARFMRIMAKDQSVESKALEKARDEVSLSSDNTQGFLQ